MKIHQTKSRCGIGDSFDNTCMSQDNQSEVLASQEQNHSATSCQNSSNESQILQKVGKKPPILWPKMKDDNKYIDYQRQVLQELSPFPMSVMERINELERVMYGKGDEMFGTYVKKPCPKNRRQRKSEELKVQLRHLRRAFRKADAGSDDQIAI